MSRQRYPVGALRESGVCLVCGEPSTDRVDATVADHVNVPSPTLPLCDAHSKQDRSRFVSATILGVTTKLAPLVVAYVVGRYADVPMAAAIAAAVAAAALAYAVELALRAQVRPLCILTAFEDGEVEVDVLGQPPATLPKGGPAVRSGSALVDRTTGRLGLAVPIAAIAALVAGWQWTQSRPVVWLDNPTDQQAAVSIDGVTHTLEAGASTSVRLALGRHAVQIQTESQHMDLPLEVSWGASMLLATEPACYAIDQQLASSMATEGQLFTLGTGDWRRIACSE
ncbi:MAG: hypothetical protein KC912_01285 [Proteobacteria bacterium]|nr:hypothetical protein [Pseudomonadota bacterium]